MMLRTLWREPERFVRSYFSQVDGCYFTNDAAVKDADGHFWVTGRVDDVINVAGHRLSTMEMESAIMECSGVAEVAVVGAPDPIKGLVPAAFVTLKVGQAASSEIEQSIRDAGRREHQQDRGAGARDLHRRAAQDAERQDHAAAAQGDHGHRRGRAPT